MNVRATDSTDEKTQEFYTVKELASYLRVTPATIYRYVEKRRIRVHRLPRGLRFRKTDIDEFLNSQITPRIK